MTTDPTPADLWRLAVGLLIAFVLMAGAVSEGQEVTRESAEGANDGKQEDAGTTGEGVGNQAVAVRAERNQGGRYESVAGGMRGAGEVDDAAAEVLAACLSGEAGQAPVADHAAILFVLHRLADKRGQSVERVTRAHCNASVSAKGQARVQANRLRRPQEWEALVQYVESFDVETARDPCHGKASTWGGERIEGDRLRIADCLQRRECVRVDCGRTANTFLGSSRTRPNTE